MSSRHFPTIPAVILILQFVALTFLSLTTFFADTEIWAVAQSNLPMSEAWTHRSLLYKPLFHFLLRLASWPASTSAEGFTLARALFAAVSLVHLLVLFRILKTLLPSDRFTPILSLILCLSSYMFLSRGFRIRSDLLAEPLLLFALLRTLRHPALWAQRNKSWWLMQVSTLGLAFLMTPKAALGITLLIALDAFFYMGPKTTVFLALRKHKTLTASIMAILFGYLVIQGSSYLNAASYFARGFMGPTTWNPNFFSWRSFEYVELFFRRDPLIIALALTGAFYGLARSQGPVKNSAIKLACLYALLRWTIVIAYPEKLPFYIAALLPTLGILLGVGLTHLGNMVPSKFSGSPAKVMLSLFALCVTAVWSQDLASKNSNDRQREAWLEMESYFSRFPEAKIYDGFGAFYHRKQVYAFVAPGQKVYREGNLKHLILSEPDIVLYFDRAQLLGQEFTRYLDTHFRSHGHGLYVRTLAATSAPSESALYYPFPNVIDPPTPALFAKEIPPSAIKPSKLAEIQALPPIARSSMLWTKYPSVRLNSDTWDLLKFDTGF